MQAESENIKKMMGLKEINNMFGRMDNFYYSVLQLGYYLPKLGSSTVTSDYLLGVVKGNYFCPKNSEICLGGASTVKMRSKVQLYELLLPILEKKTTLELGFDLSKLPNKQFLLDLIYLINPEH